VAIFGSLPLQLFVDINFGAVMTAQTIRPSSGLANVKYEIRGKLARRAQEMERLGYDIISLNIGNPGAFGFRTPETMSTKPIFVATHPRACSTAFERASLAQFSNWPEQWLTL